MRLRDCAAIPPLRGPTRHKLAWKKKSARSGRDDSGGGPTRHKPAWKKKSARSGRDDKVGVSQESWLERGDQVDQGAEGHAGGAFG
jgi:hypothetical protein